MSYQEGRWTRWFWEIREKINIKEQDDRCDLNNEHTTKIIETSWFLNLQEVIKF